LSATFSYLPGIAADGKGSLYLADERHHRVRKVDPEGTITTIAGKGGTGGRNGGFNGNDQKAVDARLNKPFDVKVGPAGVYISDQGNRQIRTVDDLGVIRAAPGAGLATTARCLGKGGKEKEPEVPGRASPVGLATNRRGDTYFTLQGRNQILKLDNIGRITPVAGRPGSASCAAECRSFSGDGGPATKALLSAPTALAVDTKGNIYFSDAQNYRVRFINRGTRTVKANGVSVRPGRIKTVAGNGTPGSAGDGGKATQAGIAGVASMTVDRKGNFYFIDDSAVRKVDVTGTISAFAGKGAPAPRDQCCGHPVAVAADATGNLYVSDVEPGNLEIPARPRVWLINQSKQSVTVRGQQVAAGAVAPVVGTGAYGFGGDGGRALDAELTTPSGLALDDQGDLFISEQGDRQNAGFAGDVRRVDPGGMMTLVAGNGLGGFNGDEQKSRLTSLNPGAIAVLNGCGDLVVADAINSRIRRLVGERPCERP